MSRNAVEKFIKNQRKNLNKPKNYANVLKEFEGLLLIQNILTKIANSANAKAVRKIKNNTRVTGSKGGMTPAGKRALALAKRKRMVRKIVSN
jgi:hypothetical protein